MTDAPIPAATVLLLRDEPAFEVLMIARHERSSFAGGALVFPGGRVDPGDRAPEWRSHATGLADDPAMAAAQIAAIREAYEEVGVLLARDRSGAILSGAEAEALSGSRAEIVRNVTRFLDLIHRERLTLACDALHLFAHWTAPPDLHKRFDTLFFAARFPASQQALEDGDEATEALWISPQDSLAARASGARKIIFPTACNLGLLGASNTVEEVIAFAAERLIRSVTPQLEMRDGRPFLIIPGDLGYPFTAEPLESAARI